MQLAPRGTHKSGSGVTKAGLPLKQSIFTRVDTHFDLIVGTVGSRVDHAATVHQGSKAHYIRAKGKLLKFEWPRGNFLLKRQGRRGRKYFYFKTVNHPGNKRPVRYLTTPMHLYGRANGFITVSTPVSRSRLP